MVLTQEKKRILVLRYRFIGDTILTVPFLRNLRRAEPDAHIAWVVAPGSSEVVKGIPYVDEMIYWDPVTIHADSRGTHRTLGDKWRFIRELRQQRFDKVYVLKRSFSSAIIAWLTGAQERIGFDTESRSFLLTKRIPYRQDQHEVQNFLDVLKADSVTIADDHLEIWTSEEEEKSALEILAQAGVGSLENIVAVHPFAANSARGWPMENFAEIVKRFSASGCSPLLLGGPKDREECGKIKAIVGQRAVDLVGRCNIRTTIALLRKCQLFVGNDSGVMHLAAAAGIPLVALFGPQSPVKFGPWSNRAAVIYKAFNCSPCRQKFFTECEPSPRMRPACVEAISVDEVFSVGMELINSAKEGNNGDN